MISELDCGFFAYRPVLQSRVHRLALLVTLKQQICLHFATLCEDRSTFEAIRHIQNAMEDRCDVIGLNAALSDLGSELAVLLSGLGTLAGLSGQKTKQELLVEFEKHSPIMAQNRAKSKCIHTHGASLADS